VAEPRAREHGRDLTAGFALGPGPSIDISTPDGARMQIRLEPGRGLDAAGLVASFLGLPVFREVEG